MPSTTYDVVPASPANTSRRRFIQRSGQVATVSALAGMVVPKCHAAEASEKKNLKVACGFMWRHSKARQEVIQRIHDGAIGQVHTLRIYRLQGPRVCAPLSEGANELLFQLQRPNEFTWITSGLFVDWQCHNVDVACWTKGAWPVSAQAMGGRCYPTAGNQFDHFTIEYTFADGTKLFTFFRHMSGCWNTYSDYAHGSKGSAVIMSTLPGITKEV